MIISYLHEIRSDAEGQPTEDVVHYFLRYTARGQAPITFRP